MTKELHLDLTSTELRRLGRETTELIIEFFANVHKARVFPGKKQSVIERVLTEPLPERGQKPETILTEVRKKIIPNTTLLGSPRYFAFVNGSGTMMSIFADAIAAAINQPPGAWKAAPAATELEKLTVRWLAEMIGYPTDCGGLLMSGGTMANLVGIATAIHDKAGYDIVNEGLQSRHRKGRFTLYMSDHEGHSSIVKVAQILGLGRNSVRRVASNPDFTINVDALEEKIKEDLAEGNAPFCVVGQVGSINVSIVDSLEDIADICSKHNLWFHADGAIGAVGRIIPRKRHLFDGLELADSVTLDPHKWLFISYECGCILVKDAEKLRSTFALLAPYLRGTIPSEYTGLDYLEYGPQMSRGFRALKLWMSIKHFGLDGYRKLLERNVELIEYLDALVRGDPNFESLSKPVLNIYCFRYNPKEGGRPKYEENDLNRLNQMIVDEVQLSGVAFLMTSSIRGKTVIRICITNHRTTSKDIELTFNAIRKIAWRLKPRRGLASEGVALIPS